MSLEPVLTKDDIYNLWKESNLNNGRGRSTQCGVGLKIKKIKGKYVKTDKGCPTRIYGGMEKWKEHCRRKHPNYKIVEF